MRLSAILTTRNRDHLLAKVLDSICAQPLDRSEYEIIIVDDGSSDTTAAVAEKFSDQLPVRYFYQDHAGIAAARNHGLAKASAPIVLMMDDDDLIHQHTLVEHLRSHEKHPEPEVAILGFTKIDEKIVSPLMSFVTDVGGHLFGYRNAKECTPLGFNWFWGGRTSFKRDYVLESGGFNPVFQFGCEDIELGYRLSKRGLRIFFNPQAVSVMIRAFTFEGFCRRLYMQGRSQRIMSGIYPEDEAVQNWCEIPRFERQWPRLRTDWLAKIEAAERANSSAEKITKAGQQVGPKLLQKLHQRYHAAFTLAKFAGIAGEHLEFLHLDSQANSAYSEFRTIWRWKSLAWRKSWHKLHEDRSTS